MAEALKLGDTMRITTELLKDIDRQPLHQSCLVKVVEIRDEADGTKLLVLQRAEN